MNEKYFFLIWVVVMILIFFGIFGCRPYKHERYPQYHWKRNVNIRKRTNHIFVGDRMYIVSYPGYIKVN